jgi:SAM-dependent methyltransferase
VNRRQRFCPQSFIPLRQSWQRQLTQARREHITLHNPYTSCQTSRLSQFKSPSKSLFRNKPFNLRPSSNTEHRRLEAQAERLRELVGNKIAHAPLEAPSVNKIVEIGCGTGITTDEFGATYPQARVFGVDLSPVPALRPKPENVEYIQGDVFELKASSGDERLARGSFDYVFSRALMAGINKWDEYLKLCVALAKPGVSLKLTLFRAMQKPH